jgi:hypothetical protein
MRVRTLVAMVLLFGAGSEAAAQTSIYGLRGLGYPGRFANSRARALGGSLAAIDGGSPVNPGAVAGFARISVAIMGETDVRDYAVGAVAATGLSATRFPLVMVGGPVGRSRMSFAVSYSQYTERSYDLTLSDTLDLRGAPVGYDERTTSRGGMSDLRGAVGYRLGSRVQLGAAFHVLTGSAKLTFSRVFADSTYLPYQVESEEALTGLGLSLGGIWSPSRRIVVGLAVRSDTRAKLKVDSIEAGKIDLPLSVTGGAQYAITSVLRLSTSLGWRGWGSADDDLAARAFDTWELAAGLEFGAAGLGRARFPLRLGYRYATLPFSPTGRQPYEYGLSGGLGIAFGGGRGLIDVAVERLIRDGAGAREKAWQLSWTVTVRP